MIESTKHEIDFTRPDWQMWPVKKTRLLIIITRYVFKLPRFKANFTTTCFAPLSFKCCQFVGKFYYKVMVNFTRLVIKNTPKKSIILVSIYWLGCSKFYNWFSFEGSFSDMDVVTSTNFLWFFWQCMQYKYYTLGKFAFN